MCNKREDCLYLLFLDFDNLGRYKFSIVRRGGFSEDGNKKIMRILRFKERGRWKVELMVY